MRLIDADPLIDDVDGDLTDAVAERIAIEKIENAPTIDAVPVVRCKDCKHWQEDWTPEAHTGHYCSQTDLFSNAEFYCADGERRESE